MLCHVQKYTQLYHDRAHFEFKSWFCTVEFHPRVLRLSQKRTSSQASLWRVRISFSPEYIQKQLDRHATWIKPLNILPLSFLSLGESFFALTWWVIWIPLAALKFAVLPISEGKWNLSTCKCLSSQHFHRMKMSSESNINKATQDIILICS